VTEAVRDLMGRSRTHRLTERQAMAVNACERLSAEAATVDAIDLFQARAAIKEVDLLKSGGLKLRSTCTKIPISACAWISFEHDRIELAEDSTGHRPKGYRASPTCTSAGSIQRPVRAQPG
jgi:hypothetical protein